jgi:translation initiation factor 3 subunit E
MENINAVFTYGKAEYEDGNYAVAADILYHFRILSTDNEMTTWATWGKFAADILSYNWDDSLEELQTLRDTIDQRV